MITTLLTDEVTLAHQVALVVVQALVVEGEVKVESDTENKTQIVIHEEIID